MSDRPKRPMPSRTAFLGLAFFGISLAVGVLIAISIFGGRARDPVVQAPVVNEEVAAGLAIAEANCARCHALGKTGDSPVAEAPPFRTLQSKWPVENLEEALAEGIVVGHDVGEMPEFQMSPEQIGAFIAYLKSL